MYNRRNANWTGHILCRNCILEDKEQDIHSLDNIRKCEILKIQTESTRSHTVENLLWKRLWTRLKTDYRMNEYTSTPAVISLYTSHVKVLGL